MPVFIPIMIGGAVGKAVLDMYRSDKLDSQANDKSLKAMNRMAEAAVRQNRKVEEARTALMRLANRKKAVLSTTMTSFLDLYQQIITINFTEHESLMKPGDFSLDMAEELNTSVCTVKEFPTNSEAMATLAVWGAAAAASVIIAANPLLVIPAITHSVKRDSERNLDSARVLSRKASAVEEQSRTVSLAHEAIAERAARITKVITDLNLLFMKSISHTQEILGKNGEDKTRYTPDERKSLAVCMNLASAIKKLLDTPLLDQEGEITAKSLEAIQSGEEFLQKIELTLIQQ